MSVNTFYGELLQKEEGQYERYVFQNLDEQENSWNRYMVVTKPPNWTIHDITIGSKGYVTFEDVNAGEEYYSTHEQCTKTYRYSASYFRDFIEKTDMTNKEYKM